jgi:hypothetical protein
MPSLRGYEFTDLVSSLDEADGLWVGLCLERDAACKQVSECLLATESGSIESYKRLKEARHRAQSAQQVMLRFLDVLDVAK